ncbi:hypothetical protein F4X90_00615 [Candidatus Poribacteria bacterium]|nr:hypothetical protein [Candidatus Poribacteria bacterium]
MRTAVFVATFTFLTVFGTANAKILFVDDFEQDDIGKEPSNWEHLNFNSGNSKIIIEKDPADPGNKAAKTTGIGLYIPIADGREEWRDYIWDFDWLWENDSFVGTIYRVEGGLKGAESHFHGSRRTGAVNIQIYTRKAGAWALVGTGQFPNENNVWYTHRLVMKGGQHQIYLRKREDELPPSDWHLNEKPIVEVDNDTFKTGPVGMMGITGGVSYFDNMVVVESVADIDKVRPVSPRLKLAATWGVIKTKF